MFAISRMSNNDSQAGAQPDVFQGVLDRYHGITIDSTKEPCSGTDQFTSKLKSMLKKSMEFIVFDCREK
jgi:hypothetical protein